MLALFLLASWFPDWVKQLLNRYLLVVVQEAIPCGSACFARAATIMGIGIFRRVFVAALAMRNISSCFYGGLNSCSTLISRIIVLLFSRGPSTVSRFVIPVVIDPIKGHSRGTHSHIGDEVLKPGSLRRNAAPSVAHGNSAASPIRVVGIRLILAPLNHSRPCVVHRLQRFIAHVIPPFINGANYTT